MDVPEDLQYSTDHEWVRTEGAVARVGITDYARDALGDVVFLSLPEVGATLAAGAVAGEVESTKAVSEIYAPLAGTVAEVNESLVNDPEIINTEPYGAGWLFALSPTNTDAPSPLMDADAYRALIQN